MIIFPKCVDLNISISFMLKIDAKCPCMETLMPVVQVGSTNVGEMFARLLWNKSLIPISLFAGSGSYHIPKHMGRWLFSIYCDLFIFFLI